MSKHQSLWLKVTIWSFFASIIFVAGQGVTRADPLTIATTGCFGVGCSPDSVTELSGLKFTGSSSESDSILGTFTLDGDIFSSDPGAYAGKTFTLNVQFTQPGIKVAPLIFNAPLNLTADINGALNGLSIEFSDNGVKTFSVFGLDDTLLGSFQLTIDPFEITKGSTGTLTGTVTGEFAPVPEPASLLLLGTGLTGLIGYARRRRKRNPPR